METDEEKEKLHRLEDMKTKLFSKSYKSILAKRSGILHRTHYDIADEWQNEEHAENLTSKIFMKTSLFKKFFIFSIGFFLIALIFAGYTFFGGGNTVSNENIDIQILGNTFTAGGEELPLQIEITNKNSAALELADLIVEYPKGSSTDLSQDVNRIRDSLGTIPAGKVQTDNVKVVLFGEQGSTRPVKISIEYRVEGSNAIFVKEKDYSVSISSAPIDLSINAPDEMSPNQDVTFIVKTNLNATKPISGLLLKVDYPTGFQITTSNPTPTNGSNIWDLGDLSPGAERDISITGKIIGAGEGEQKSFHFFVGSPNASDKSSIGVIFNSVGHTVLIKKPFIQARLLVNGVYQSEYASDSNTNISGSIEWVNNLTTKLNDVSIVAKISGSALDKNKIISQNGFYNSLDNTITWDRNSLSQFTQVDPGDTGTVDFSLHPVSLFSSGGLVSDPLIHIDVSISGKQPQEGNTVSMLTDSESKTIKIISDLGFINKALYYSGAFPNTGPIPPKVGQETTYTVVWSISNTSNNISKAKISSTLPSWARFVGPVSPAAEDLQYNANTKEIAWNIGIIPKGTGIAGGTKEVSFQIAFTPSLSQVGTAPILINDSALTAHDDFANVDLRVNKSSLTTNLASDSALPSGGARVVQ
ncbi:MAG: hypothetical protein NTZ44_03310 [Candidatus Nomurabacteria bacterium]|nr:hypothetical protein [Candidatus Nomurabacteria bacterium]